MWWIYFDRPVHDLLTSFRKAFMWGYGHYVVFASAAAVGAGLAVNVDFVTGHSKVSAVAAGYAVAIPAAVYLSCLWLLHDRPEYRRTRAFGPVTAALDSAQPVHRTGRPRDRPGARRARDVKAFCEGWIDPSTSRAAPAPAAFPPHQIAITRAVEMMTCSMTRTPDLRLSKIRAELHDGVELKTNRHGASPVDAAVQLLRDAGLYDRRSAFPVPRFPFRFRVPGSRFSVVPQNEEPEREPWNEEPGTVERRGAIHSLAP